MSESARQDRAEVKSDEEWKEQVRSEARQLDEQSRMETTSEAERETQAVSSDGDLEFLPPASFAMLVQMFSTQAIVATGSRTGSADRPDHAAAQAGPAFH